MSYYDRIENDFKYHPPADSRIPDFKTMRDQARMFAHIIDTLVPDGREKATALTKLEEVVFWSNAGLAREWTSAD